MSRPKVERSRSRAWLHVAVLALVGTALAGCENSARFDSNPFASNRQAPRREVTGSIGTRPENGGRVESQPLPAPSRPSTVAANGGVAYGDRGFTAYRPETRGGEVTGSVSAHRTPPKPAGHWTWNGGEAVIVGRGETLKGIAHKNGVPLFALMQTNGISNEAAIHPGQRLVIPRYVYDSAPSVPAAAPSAARLAGGTHVVEPGETLMGIARRSGVSLSELAHANNMQAFSTIKIGQRLVIPGGHKVAERQEVTPKLTQPHTVRSEKVAEAPTQSARVAKAEFHDTASIEPEHKTQSAAAVPTFRWPVKGRIISGFGPKPNGTQNDGINLAVPEGTPIKAADDGVVAYAGNELKGYGNLVLIRHADGYVSAYADASKLLVTRGEHVRRGQVIARAGQTGNVNSPQLHFEIRKGSTPVDPTRYLGGA
jgi:murein DD-endopeptidase MepM/ murein hydrolase activator NlpD